jgi:hypothetical protein
MRRSEDQRKRKFQALCQMLLMPMIQLRPQPPNAKVHQFIKIRCQAFSSLHWPESAGCIQDATHSMSNHLAQVKIRQ